MFPKGQFFVFTLFLPIGKHYISIEVYKFTPIVTDRGTFSSHHTISTILLISYGKFGGIPWQIFFFFSVLNGQIYLLN